MMPVGRVNVSVANLYRLSDYASEVVSQALLGEQVSVLQQEKNFSRVQLEDGYEGWISNHQWVSGEGAEGSERRVRSHVLQILEKSDPVSRPVRDAVIGCRLKVGAIKAGWVKVFLPDGQSGYAPESAFGVFPEFTREGVRQLALEFLGYPYHWGGRSPKGFDCSGLVQTVFSLVGIKLPRDSWMQHRDGLPADGDPAQARPGDLYFFAENKGKISHVGIALGDGQILHARGMVRINSLRKTDAAYMPDLEETWVGIRTYFERS